MGWGKKDNVIVLPELEEHEWAELEKEQLSSEVLESVWDELEGVQVDASDRKLIWPDGARLGVDESLQRLKGVFSDCPPDMVEAHLIGWLEQEYVPEGYSQDQMDRFDEIMNKWVDELQGISVDLGDENS